MRTTKNLIYTWISENKNLFFFITFSIQCILGSIFLGVMSQFSVKLFNSPIPITLQTFGLYLLLLSMGTSRTFGSVVLFLAQASAGLPVLAGGMVNPLWMTGPTAGFLLGFLAFAVVSGSLLEFKRRPSMVWTFFSLLIGTLVINLLGIFYLSFFLNKTNIISTVILPIIPGSLIKIISASFSSKPIYFLKDLLKNWIKND